MPLAVLSETGEAQWSARGHSITSGSGLGEVAAFASHRLALRAMSSVPFRTKLSGYARPENLID
jgi:hypothetical protein